MLAIVPGYDGSGSEESENSEDDDKSLLRRTNQEAGDADKSNITKNGIVSGSSRTPQKRSTGDLATLALPKFLALMKRKEEGLKEMEGVEDLPKYRKRRRGKGRGKRKANYDESMATMQTTKASNCGSSKSSASHSTNESTEQWATTLESYLGVNDHLKGSQVDHGDLGPKSGLEKLIDQAADDGNIDQAEELSDLLADRNFAVRIAEAANARDYSKRKQEEEEMKQVKRKKKLTKLAWGFEVKHRWEMKGNM